MTEAEWLAGDDTRSMLAHARAHGDMRRHWLFACGCCRAVWHLLREGARQAVEAVERYADGQATEEEVASCFRGYEDYPLGYVGEPPGQQQAGCAVVSLGWRWRWWGRFPPRGRPADSAAAAVEVVSRRAAEALAKTTLWREARLGQSGLLRCVFGSPFRPPALAPTWGTPDVLSLAQAAYEERPVPAGRLEPARLAVLADALEDAGCDNAEILGHLRGEGPHVRGCWAVDWLLGKT